MKDLFTGSLGKLDNHGGSRFFTTPNTREVKPEYEIATNIPSVAEFVTCSLDGRLWVFKRSRRFYIAVLRYDEVSEKLVFVKSEVLSEGNIIGRGVDWILTDKNIIQASDDEPYIRIANLFDDDVSSFLYSVLRSKEIPSGIDRTTNKAWGLSEDNGNSDGYGYFNRLALLQSVNKHYSLLPAIGDWHIIKNFLVRKADNPLTEAHNSMLNIRPLIPLEFNGSNPAYGCGFDNDIFLTYYNGKLWGRGLYHIGRCYTLPAVFDEKGNVQEFYLYISPDYPRIAVTQADKLNLGILKTADNLYGFLTAQVSSLDNNLCYTSDNPKLFQPSTKQWQQISESGQMFIDTLNHSSVVLSEDSAKFIDGSSYECKGINQWLAPAAIVDAVSPQYVISSVDNATITTYHQQGFHRELLASKKLPITATSYSGKRLSLGLKSKKIQVNSSVSHNTFETIKWQNIYNQAVEIKHIHFFTNRYAGTIYDKFPIFIAENCWDSVRSILPDTQPTWSDPNFYVYCFEHYGLKEYEIYPGYIRGCPIVPAGVYMTPQGTFFDGERVWGFPDGIYNSTVKLFYIHPDSGEPIFFTMPNFETSDFSSDYMANDIDSRLRFLQQYEFPDFDVPAGITIQNGQIGYEYTHYSNNMENYEDRFQPVCSISDFLPSAIVNWQKSSLGCISLQSFHFPVNIPKNITCPASAVFSEKHSNAKFLYEIPSVFTHTNGNTLGVLASYLKNDDLYLKYHNYWNINSLSNDETYSKQCLHVAIASSFTTDDSSHFFVFRSELHPEIFDFKSESERSKLS